ncbi:hypothetical protein NUH30_19105 [Leptospira sp. 85282-16]|uniref:hypothetical protein n=1 Tax=Leptospira sp. 85282-16 TaxID=2971256 RepID=UPI0021C10699|nr:hypothetical protein [Leptospira sp. 85282-16]MCT8335803.1 hypothetical protein [Leptospira sp. 85282-16]
MYKKSRTLIIFIFFSCITTYEKSINKQPIDTHPSIIIESSKLYSREIMSELSYTTLILSGLSFGILPAYYDIEEEHRITLYSQEFKLLNNEQNVKINGRQYLWIPLIFWPSSKLQKSDILNKENDKLLSKINYLENKIKIIKSKKLPLLIKKSIHDINSAGGVTIEMEIENLSMETIKYIEFELELFNAVNDRIKCDIRLYHTASANITGPIDTKATNKYYWENLWYNHSAEYITIKNVKIIYFNSERKLTDSEIKEIEIE